MPIEVFLILVCSMVAINFLKHSSSYSGTPPNAPIRYNFFPNQWALFVPLLVVLKKNYGSNRKPTSF